MLFVLAEKVPQKSSNMDVAIIAGVIVCCGLLLALVLAFIMYRLVQLVVILFLIIIMKSSRMILASVLKIM